MSNKNGAVQAEKDVLQEKLVALPEPVAQRIQDIKQQYDDLIKEFSTQKQRELNEKVGLLIDGFVLSLENGDKRKFILAPNMTHLIEH